MKIYRNILNDILSQMPTTPPEAGGIIGGKKGEICIWEFDAGYKERGCIYRPNVNYLNNVISTWIDGGFDFMGILHVHFGRAKYLSDGDKKYIQKIMENMPEYINQLYFPIVVQPEKELFSYIAIRDLSGGVGIKEEEVTLV